jgi:motility quorum-sensing regulator/GCU-specific mRNA interferase toxin
MGLTDVQMLDVIASLASRDFYKSMTTHGDHRVWQDVYHGSCPNGLVAYIKLTQVADRIVIQFKEK